MLTMKNNTEQYRSIIYIKMDITFSSREDNVNDTQDIGYRIYAFVAGKIEKSGWILPVLAYCNLSEWYF